MGSKKISTYEGLQENIKQLRTPDIEVWENQYPQEIYTVTLDVPEFTCICPKTGLPDFARIRIDYIPYRTCVELKSFKMYTGFFRNIGIFHEHLVNKLMDDFLKACSPRWVKVVIEFNPRGGIQTTVSREYRKR